MKSGRRTVKLLLRVAAVIILQPRFIRKPLAYHLQRGSWLHLRHHMARATHLPRNERR
jgi:hypothetical protein